MTVGAPARRVSWTLMFGVEVVDAPANGSVATKRRCGPRRMTGRWETLVEPGAMATVGMRGVQLTKSSAPGKVGGKSGCCSRS
jgi:hypothetical protein